MKRSHLLFFAAGFFLLWVWGNPVNAQEKPSSGKKTTHIRTVTLKDGKEQVFDTVYTGEDVRVLRLDGKKSITWFSHDSTLTVEALSGEPEGLPDSVGKAGKVIVMKHQGGRKPLIITGTETEGDSGKKVVVYVEKVSPGDEEIIIGRRDIRPGRRMIAGPFPPGAPFPPSEHVTIMNRRDRNVINLADPGIISYKKKKMSGGREKITIIRNEVKEAEGDLLNFQIGNDDDELKKMNAPKVVRELEIQKKEPGKPVEIRTK